MNKNLKKGLVPYLLLTLLLLSIYYGVSVLNREVHNYTYNEFIEYIEKNEVEEVKTIPSSRGGIYEITGKLKIMIRMKVFQLKLH